MIDVIHHAKKMKLNNNTLAFVSQDTYKKLLSCQSHAALSITSRRDRQTLNVGVQRRHGGYDAAPGAGGGVVKGSEPRG